MMPRRKVSTQATKITPWITEGYMVKLRDGRQVEVSRRQAKALRDLLEI